MTVTRKPADGSQTSKVLAFIEDELAAGRPFPSSNAIDDYMGWRNGARDTLTRLVRWGELKVVERTPSGNGWKYTYALARN